MSYRKPLFVLSTLLVGAGSLLFSAQAPAKNQQAQGEKKGPPIPGGTGGPGGTSQAERMRNFLGIGAPPDPAAVERGKKIFVTTCGFCHGANANGGESGPDLVRSVIVLHDENGNEIGPVILKGRPDKGMPAFASMTQAQISDIAAFLRSRHQAAANRGAYQIQNIITGDAKAGEAYFNGAGKCSTCHSPTGDLAGIATKHNDPVALQSLFLYPQPPRRRDDNSPRRGDPQVTVTLPSGQSVSGKLEHLDDFNVALRDSSGVYHSWEIDDEKGMKVAVNDPLAGHVELLRQLTDADMHNVLAYLETLK